MLLVFTLAALGATTPRFPELTSEEWERIHAGEVVMRAQTDGSRVTATGIVKIDAPPEALWPAVLDIEARIPEGKTLTSVKEYKREGPHTWFLEVDMEVVGADLKIHHRYDWDPARDQATYSLDPSRPNDLAVADGWYLVRRAEGGSLLVFQSVTEAKVPVPGWVKRWLARDQMEELLDGIRARAEKGPERRG